MLTGRWWCRLSISTLDKTVTLDKMQLFVKSVNDYKENRTTVDRKVVTLAQKTHQFEISFVNIF